MQGIRRLNGSAIVQYWDAAIRKLWYTCTNIYIAVATTGNIARLGGVDKYPAKCLSLLRGRSGHNLYTCLVLLGCYASLMILGYHICFVDVSRPSYGLFRRISSSLVSIVRWDSQLLTPPTGEHPHGNSKGYNRTHRRRVLADFQEAKCYLQMDESSEC